LKHLIKRLRKSRDEKARAQKSAECRVISAAQLHDIYLLSSTYTEDVGEAVDSLVVDGKSADKWSDRGPLFPSFFDSGERYLQFIEALLQKHQPRVIVETGVAHGVSTRRILAAFDRLQEKVPALDAVLHSVDVDPRTKWPDLSEDPRWVFHLSEAGNRIDHILASIGTIDMFIHDSDHSYKIQMLEYQSAWKHLRPGGVLVSDDISWSNAFVDFCSDKGLAPVVLSEAPKVAGAVLKPLNQKS